MTEQAPANTYKPSWFRALASDLREMPGYLKFLMIGAVSLVCLGVVGQTRNWMDEKSPMTSSVQTAPDMTNTRGVVRSAPQSTSDAPAKSPEKKSTWSSWSTRVGAGFLVGFIVGWIFRFFLKTMAILTALGAAIFFGLSYLGFLNVDLSSAKTEYSNFLSWLTDQGHRLVSVIYAKLNATVPTAIGAFFGFRTKG